MPGALHTGGTGTPEPPAHPTLVLGVGEWLEAPLEQLAGLLEAFGEGIRPITRVALVAGGQLRDLLPAGPGSAGDLARGIVERLEAIRAEENLERARHCGMQVAMPGGHLVLRAVLVVDGTGAERAPEVVEALRVAARQLQPPLPLRVVCLSLPRRAPDAVGSAPGAARLDAGFPPPKSGRPDERIELLDVVVVDRVRSDGSSLDEAELQRTLAFLLGTALLPAQTEDHWFFRRPAVTRGSTAQLAFGLGLLVVPVAEIETALQDALLRDLLALAVGAPARGARAEPCAGDASDFRLPLGGVLHPAEVEKAFDERAVWLRLFTGLPVRLIGLEGAADPFAVELLEGQVRLDLTAHHWKDWCRLLADYDARWEEAVGSAWVRLLEEQAAAEEKELARRLGALLDWAVEEGQGFPALAGAALRSVRRCLEVGWRCDGKEIRTDVPDPDLSAGREALMAALRRVPNAWALGARCFLTVLLLVQAAFWSARALLTADPLFGIAVGLFVGGFAPVLAVWQAALQWHRGVREVTEARDRCLEAMAQKYAAALRSHGILLLRRIRRALLERIEVGEADLGRIEAQWRETARRAGDAAKRFSPRTSGAIRPAVRDPGEIERFAAELWGGRDLRPLLRELLAGASLRRWEDVLALTGPGPAGDAGASGEAAEAMPCLPEEALLDRLRQAAGTVLRCRLLAGRRPTLRDWWRVDGRFRSREERDDWLRAEIRELHAQAERTLWPGPGQARAVWQIVPAEDEELAAVAAGFHPEEAPRVALPGMLGTVIRREVNGTHDPP